MKTLKEIRREIDTATERRAELWRVLGEGSDPALSTELKELDEHLERLWDEHRTLRAQVRFGDRDEIIARARHEERLARAA
jgi:galactokinase/mevalonate kinase-like predicted kinase